MPGLVPGIHDLTLPNGKQQDVDGRAERSHDALSED